MRYRIVNSGGGAPSVFIYGDITEDGNWWSEDAKKVITPSNFKEQLDIFENTPVLNIFINSKGGDVFAGQAIYSMLKRLSAKKIVYIDGLAASIASVIAMAGDVIKMPVNAMMMIHEPMTIAVGGASDFRKTAEILDAVSETIIAVYKSRPLAEGVDVHKLMAVETWMTANTALQYGFIDEIDEHKIVTAKWGKDAVVNGVQMSLKEYKNYPKEDFSLNMAEAIVSLHRRQVRK